MDINPANIIANVKEILGRQDVDSASKLEQIKQLSALINDVDDFVDFAGSADLNKIFFEDGFDENSLLFFNQIVFNIFDGFITRNIEKINLEGFRKILNILHLEEQNQDQDKIKLQKVRDEIAALIIKRMQGFTDKDLVFSIKSLPEFDLLSSFNKSLEAFFDKNKLDINFLYLKEIIESFEAKDQINVIRAIAFSLPKDLDKTNVLNLLKEVFYYYSGDKSEIFGNILIGLIRHDVDKDEFLQFWNFFRIKSANHLQSGRANFSLDEEDAIENRAKRDEAISLLRTFFALTNQELTVEWLVQNVFSKVTKAEFDIEYNKVRAQIVGAFLIAKSSKINGPRTVIALLKTFYSGGIEANEDFEKLKIWVLSELILLQKLLIEEIDQVFLAIFEEESARFDAVKKVLDFVFKTREESGMLSGEEVSLTGFMQHYLNKQDLISKLRLFESVKVFLKFEEISEERHFVDCFIANTTMSLDGDFLLELFLHLPPNIQNNEIIFNSFLSRVICDANKYKLDQEQWNKIKSLQLFSKDYIEWQEEEGLIKLAVTKTFCDVATQTEDNVASPAISVRGQSLHAVNEGAVTNNSLSNGGNQPS